MSEYQYYEFLAIDAPLTEKQRTELGKISSRADITATRFVNEYDYGDLKADPAKLVERYFDAMVHVANWGTRWFLARLPRGGLDVAQLRAFHCPGQCGMEVKATRQHVVLSFLGEDEECDYDDMDQDARALSRLVEIRREIQRGDLRALYLAWLRAAQFHEVDEDAQEPPVPPGLRKLSAPQRALAAFLHLDPDLLKAAAKTSPTGDASTQADPKRLRAWIRALPAKDKDAMLGKVAEGKDPGLLARFHLEQAKQARKRPPAASGKAPPRRTVRELLEAAGIAVD